MQPIRKVITARAFPIPISPGSPAFCGNWQCRAHSTCILPVPAATSAPANTMMARRRTGVCWRSGSPGGSGARGGLPNTRPSRRRAGAGRVGWAVKPVALPPAKDLDQGQLEAQLKAHDNRFLATGGASRLAWLRRRHEGRRVEIACLRLGRARILHLPGELFVEYQLAAKAERPDLFVAMAAYGDYAPWYIGTAIAYEQGGYETTPPASNVGPGAEAELLRASHALLQD